MAQRKIVMDEETKKLLSNSDSEIMPREIEVKRQKYYLKKFISSMGVKSVVWKGVDEYGEPPLAIKFVTYEDYLDRPYLQEANNYAKLRRYPETFADFYNAGIIDIPINAKKIKCICFVEEFIEGQTLEDYIQNNEITPSFIINYIRKMCSALNILKTLNYRHDDLHPGNVVIEPPKKETLSQEYTVKVIDMGSLKPFDSPLTKDKDDHGWFTEHLRILHNSMLFNSKRQRKPLSLIEKRFRKEMIPLLNSMLEEDKQIALREPSKIISLFEQAHIRAQRPDKERELKLKDPFDYISAEHIVSDRLLINLFAESCPWVKEVVSPNPVLLTGPRGCGKSMLFRRLSLKALLYKSTKDIEDSKIAGFYISCSADLANRFGQITSDPLVKRFKKEIVHYFNLLLSREIIKTLLLISQREDKENLFGLGKTQEEAVHKFVMDRLNIKDTKRLRLQGVAPFEHLLETIESEMYFCYEQFLKEVNLEFTTSVPFLSELTQFLKNKIKYFEDRTITFLLDDFSIHRISEPIQLILNSIIWDRQPSHIFKLSAEKYGAERVILESYIETSPTADITREFREIDCGQFYIALHDKGLLKELIDFAKELLDHRLVLTGYSGKSEDIIGYSQYPEGTLGKALREHNKRYDQYHGLDTISQICSGDVSALLETYRRIFSDGNVTRNTKYIVKKNIQHTAIASVSRNFLELIKSYQPYGKDMHKIVLNFGTLCKRILVDGYIMKDKRLNETTRIEVDQITGEPDEDWTLEQEKLKKELLRRAIFIDMEPGRGRATLGPTLRWQLRRIYCPAFGCSLTKSTAIKWSTSDLKYFLTNPKEKCEHEFEKVWKKEPPIDYPDLFSNANSKQEEV